MPARIRRCPRSGGRALPGLGLRRSGGAVLDDEGRARERYAAASDHTVRRCSTGGVERILAGLIAGLPSSLGGAAHPDVSAARDQPGEPRLKLAPS